MGQGMRACANGFASVGSCVVVHMCAHGASPQNHNLNEQLYVHGARSQNHNPNEQPFPDSKAPITSPLAPNTDVLLLGLSSSFIPPASSLRACVCSLARQKRRSQHPLPSPAHPRQSPSLTGRRWRRGAGARLLPKLVTPRQPLRRLAPPRQMVGRRSSLPARGAASRGLQRPAMVR